MATLLFGIGLALSLALLVAIHRKLDLLVRRLPASAPKPRAHEDRDALAALKHATTVEVATITASLRAYEEHLAEQYHQAVAATETRARVSERRSSDAGVALSTASELVRELRAVLDGLAERQRMAPRAPVPLAASVVTDLDDARKTVPMGAPAPASDDDDEEPEEELTAVAQRPIVGTAGASNGLRLPPRPAAASEGNR